VGRQAARRGIRRRRGRVRAKIACGTRDGRRTVVCLEHEGEERRWVGGGFMAVTSGHGIAWKSCGLMALHPIDLARSD
jgi:hypothetical protein